MELPPLLLSVSGHTPTLMRPLGVYVGTLPSAWGAAGAFPSLLSSNMHGATLSGTLPVSWAGNNSFAVLSELQLGCDTPGAGQLSGKLPSEWGTPTSFVSLQTLYISGAAITGDVCICSSPIGDSNRCTVHPSSACICKFHCKKR